MPDMNWSLQDMAALLGSTVQKRPKTALGQVRSICTDSRHAQAGDLFVCLTGERFDGHDFAQQVVKAGAIALVTNRILNVDIPQFVVQDTRLALGSLAHAWRCRFKLKILAVVGSNGKTSTKEMLGCICKAQYGEESVLLTQGNLNNDIGVPQTLFNLRAHHRVAVIEMGMNHAGEIDYLARLVKPDVVVLTNAQREHQEFMKTVLAVAQENGSSFAHLPPEGTAVFPVSKEFEPVWLAQSTAQVNLRFGQGSDFEFFPLPHGDAIGQMTLKTPLGSAAFTPCFFGEHNHMNAAAAAAAGFAAGCSLEAICTGLKRFKPVKGRLQLVLHTPSLLLIDDSYNANPDSVNAASKTLASQSGNTLLILGDMGEVGDQSAHCHAEVGEYAKKIGIHKLYAIGNASQHTVSAFGAGAIHFKNIESLIEEIMAVLKKGNWSLLVKGSRFMKMERVVQAIVEHVTQQGDDHAS